MGAGRGRRGARTADDLLAPLRTYLRSAGAERVDEEVVVDGNRTTSRNPDDLGAFGKAIVEQFATG